MTSQSCAHSSCRCTRPYPPQAQAASTERIDPEGLYCSRRCGEQDGGGALGDGACECGHPQCSADASTGIPPM